MDKKSYKNIVIYYIGYIIIKNVGDCESIHSVNPLHFIVGEVDGYIEENNGNKYLIFASTGKNKEVLKRDTELWNEIKKLIKTIDNKPGEYEKDFMKIKFNSVDNLPLNKILKLHDLTIIVRSVFQEDNRYYPQIVLGECLYELQKCYNMKELKFQKELTLINQINQNNVCFVIIGILKTLVVDLNHMFVINVMIS